MISKYLSPDHTVFRRMEVFEIDHRPKQLQHRDAQLRELAYALCPGFRFSRGS